jgi:hypothetical protein
MTESKTVAYQERRRSQRVHIQIPLVVRGENSAGQSFNEETQTTTVNAHGCMLRLRADVIWSAALVLSHTMTREEVNCTVVHVGSPEGKKRDVGLEFVAPSPKFWRIAFPPSDWNPAERKRPDSVTSRVSERFRPGIH